MRQWLLADSTSGCHDRVVQWAASGSSIKGRQIAKLRTDVAIPYNGMSALRSPSARYMGLPGFELGRIRYISESTQLQGRAHWAPTTTTRDGICSIKIPEHTLLFSAACELARNGRRRTTISYRMQPSDQMSDCKPVTHVV